MFAYDPQIAAAVAQRPDTIPEVLSVMRTVDGLTADGDGLKWFNGLYLTVTEAVHAQVSTSGLADPGFMAALDVEFAGLYFSALRGFLAGHPIPGCWQVLFAVRAQTRLTRIQCALAGMNAHINHDLALAIVSTSAAAGVTPDHDSGRYTDFTALNATLDGLIETAKKQLQLRLLGDEVPQLSVLEDTIAGWSMSAARENAWNNAEIAWRLRPVPLLTDRFEHGIDGVATVIGKALLVPLP
ncbi:hypothetical protein LK09_05120 [Microbacterium mangrovi]|uniref:Uncharacterized protein n=1 Tax=Microbacterium mangrovi TaxID=1348253 RepID=A0A0B2A4I7_9MICO|nr:DUF5995 family protein [Microbacterium mangrovi]KHK98389.1 hypothetical protein LK09_05120 [Microbacterium mangrovi]